MKILATGLFALMILLANSVNATIRYVSAQGAGQYTLMESGLSAAVSGDTILVGPGAYTPVGGLTQTGKRLTWIGAGWDQTVLNGTWNLSAAGTNRSSVEGFRVIAPGNHAFYVTSNCDSITIRRSHVTANYSCMLVGSGQGGRGLTVEDCFLWTNTSSSVEIIRISDGNYPTVVRNCVFNLQQGNFNCFAVGGIATSGTVELYNCVFLNTRQLFNLNTGGGPVIAVNNIFWDWYTTPSLGTYNSGSVFDYNAGPASPALPGTNVITIATDPFVSYDETVSYSGLSGGDLHLDPTNGAALINTGHPSLLDFTDSSRSDFGIYGGPKPYVDNGVPNYPWAVNVLANPNLVGTGTPINGTATVRVGPAY